MRPPFTLQFIRLAFGLYAGLAVGPSSAQVVPTVGVAPGEIALWQSARLTLALEGPAPLRVELPPDGEAEKLLAPESAAVWRVRPAGPPAVTPLADGRQRWERAYRLDSWRGAGPAGSVPLAFAPVKVTAGGDLNPHEVTWPATAVRVVATLEAKAENARPVTGVEDLPPAPATAPDATGWAVAAGLGGVFALAVVAAVVRKLLAKRPPPPPHVWADDAFARLSADHAAGRITDTDVADRSSTVLREYVERQYGLTANRLTTAELVRVCDAGGWPADRSAPLADLLARCDRAKFANAAPDPAGANDLLAQAREWVRAQHAPAGPAGR